jgi:MerR family mercuric resistance operon transcriptional regulator
VRRLLRLADERRRPCAEARAVAAAHLTDVRAKIADLRRMERVLRETVGRCKAGTGPGAP